MGLSFKRISISSSISVPNCLLLPQNPQLFHHSAGLQTLLAEKASGYDTSGKTKELIENRDKSSANGAYGENMLNSANCPKRLTNLIEMFHMGL